jgi:hypothetical protein
LCGAAGALCACCAAFDADVTFIGETPRFAIVWPSAHPARAVCSKDASLRARHATRVYSEVEM